MTDTEQAVVVPAMVFRYLSSRRDLIAIIDKKMRLTAKGSGLGACVNDGITEVPNRNTVKNARQALRDLNGYMHLKGAPMVWSKAFPDDVATEWAVDDDGFSFRV